ncbi:bis(5'-nucleosyl)-tetraphosphatase (symmetrical) YqeK [Bacteroides sp. Phil13]|uniref:bis(5'-nucleosyl)-tetraphosphatase (symmetrical) YqeK n=1 Tax=Bacteroides sp. Phil13 TaxID=1929999 RepID=UPI0025800DA8|nr:bis(5'-nucleosyl)-tetraphosphatase (symmetrical) YqeK [Bacteroides sp. Phil13]
MNQLLHNLREDMQSILKPSRFEHTMGVAYTAANLAMRYDVSMEDAYTAGLLHDNAKYMEGDAMLALCKENEQTVSATEQRNPYLLHAKAGAILARDKYGIENEDILNAITYHTTGRPGMTSLEKIIFVADYIEPNRTVIPGLDIIRQEAYVDLDHTVYLILVNTLKYLKATKDKSDIDTMTVASYDYYKNIMSKTTDDDEQ